MRSALRLPKGPARAALLEEARTRATSANEALADAREHAAATAQWADNTMGELGIRAIDYLEALQLESPGGPQLVWRDGGRRHPTAEGTATARAHFPDPEP